MFEYALAAGLTEMCIRDSLYIAQGYEVKPTTGYSVEVKERYETETAFCIKTTLIGPKKGEEKEKAETYPYIVVQTEDVKKDVLFK